MTSAIIMAGGVGLRLWPLTSTIPKALAPVGDRALIDYQIEKLRGQGFERIVVSTGYQADFVEGYVNGRHKGVAFVREQSPLGTAGTLAEVFDHLDDSVALVINCDVLTTGDLRAVIKVADVSDCPLTVATVQFYTSIPFGVVTECEEHGILAVEEKPRLCHDVVCGVYGVKRSIRSFIRAGEELDMDVLIRRVIARFGQVSRHSLDGSWLEVGRPEDLGRANEFLARECVD